MKASVPLLAPILRSDTQGRLLADLYLNPGVERTGTELARRADATLPTVSREIARLEDAGYVTSRTSGRNKYVQINTAHPLFAAMADILTYSYGPLAVLPKVLKDVRGLTSAYIYGSWAARLAGEPGRDPHDIDVLAIGDDIDLDQLDAAAEEARRRLHREVNARAVTRQAWEHADDVFLKHLKERPLVQLPLAEEDK
ncbi:ArsR family transcriptional regulator [Microbacterium protaetiae]|uniref:ArsR family transcriptional regulator n=1 Tax=Microbacterium protaetiae TaxID=2509458 RepID=A0A4V0YD97_9MICO|nr:winged helix-turn-helix domain-containing protein [Microbacterium protaetiae]QAY59951.1 ArsR family transcriptional regulator [Microbacterium protaetiae]